MFCSYCGGKLDQEAKFCTFCGKEPSSAPKAPMQEASIQTQTPTGPIQQPAVVIPKPALKKHKGKYLLCGIFGTVVGAILLVVILFAAGVFSFGGEAIKGSGGKTIEGPGFSTPEDAAKAYLTGLRDQDVDAMLATFAVESYVDNFDFEASVDRMKSYNSNYYDIHLPNTNDYTRQLNIATRRDQIADRINSQYILFNMPEEINDYDTVELEDTKAIQDFVEKFEKNTQNYVFDDLVITGTMPPEDLSDEFLVEKNQDNIAEQAKVIGVDGDDVANIAITFKADGKKWVFCPQAVRYDNKWYLQTTMGNLAYLIGLDYAAGGIAPL